MDDIRTHVRYDRREEEAVTMTESTDTPRPGEGLTPPDGQEVTPDYSRLGFRQLQALCKGRQLSGSGSQLDLIARLKEYDAAHGTVPTLDVPEPEEEPDLLADEDEALPGAPAVTVTPADGGEVASASPSAGPAAVDVGPVGSSPQMPAVVVTAAPGEPQGLPPASVRGRANLAARRGLVKVGEGHGATEVRAFREEYPHGERELTDTDHMRYIADTHAAAWAAGHDTKGGITIGERVGFGRDASGVRTVIYQVPIKRQR
jgi:hypothetical protein